MPALGARRRLSTKDSLKVGSLVEAPQPFFGAQPIMGLYRACQQPSPRSERTVESRRS